MDKTFNKSKRKGYDGIGYEKRESKLKLNINLVLFVRNIDEPVQQKINSFLFEQMFGTGCFFLHETDLHLQRSNWSLSNKCDGDFW